MGVSLVPAHTAGAGSQNQLITRELLSSWLPFPQQQPELQWDLLLLLSHVGEVLVLKAVQPSRCFELSPCLDVSVLLLLLDWLQR